MFLLPPNATHCHTLFMREWDGKWAGYFLTTRYSVPNLVLLFFKPSIFWSSLPNFCILETWREEPNFCFKMSKMAAAIRYSPSSGVFAGSKTCRKHCLIGEICSNCLLCCLIREKVVTFRMVKLNMLLSIFLITKWVTHF